MWPLKKTPPPKPPTHYGETTLQVGDDCVCVNDAAHNQTHQKLLTKGCVYKVRTVRCGEPNASGYAGPWVRLDGITPTNDSEWLCQRFEKVIRQQKKSRIVEQVMEPCDLDVRQAKREAKELTK